MHSVLCRGSYPWSALSLRANTCAETAVGSSRHRNGRLEQQRQQRHLWELGGRRRVGAFSAAELRQGQRDGYRFVVDDLGGIRAMDVRGLKDDDFPLKNDDFLSKECCFYNEKQVPW